LKALSDYIKFLIISYFSKHLVPTNSPSDSFTSKNTNYYRVEIFIPEKSNKQISKIKSKYHGQLRIKYEFRPKSNASKWGGRYLAGNQYTRNKPSPTDTVLTPSYLRYSRIDITYYFGHWSTNEKSCTLLTLTKLYLYRKIRAFYLEIFIHKIKSYIANRNTLKRLKTPFITKVELYETLMKSDSFLKNGKFKKSLLSDSLFGGQPLTDRDIYNKVSQSIDWILESCEEDGEIERISHNDDFDNEYKMKGKGINYFTITNESIKTNEYNKVMQNQQIAIQNRTLILTTLLVVATFMSVSDKLDAAQKLIIDMISPTFPYVKSFIDTLL